MSVDFRIEGTRIDVEDPATFVNLANGNACALLAWLGLQPECYGEISARDLAARCRRRLWPEARNEDPGRPGEERGRVIDGGRRAGYLPEKTRDLLELAERAEERRIVWA